VEFYPITRLYNPEGRIRHSHRCENLKFGIRIHGTLQQLENIKLVLKEDEKQGTNKIGRYIHIYINVKKQKVDEWKGVGNKDKKELN
jgi:hypothetical protein